MSLEVSGYKIESSKIVWQDFQTRNNIVLFLIYINILFIFVFDK